MGSSTTIKIRYCGGCNQAYDRVKLVSDIVKSLHEQNGKDFRVVFGRDDPADIELVICGCSACCSDTDEQKDERTPRGRFVVGPNLLNYYEIPQNDLLPRLLSQITGEEE
ncbi:MAG: hypothetical protein HPY90_02730 [Syntrophothermus sp.]|uniref:hypothetical protein n=1 Tax=Syntrophothermus sp. TaxID=2736299 RepID=UPI00257CE8A4|nr:hypothetical protein [Syntrophothermus sp.]NSW82177.1 hypothetical protein [Syntrophothermus sp.]